MSDLTHFNERGEERIVDVSSKEATAREATARGCIYASAQTLERIASDSLAKGDPLAAARLAGMMAAKRTSELIPLCHPLFLTAVSVRLELNAPQGCVDIEATVKVRGQTGVEMEALTAVSVAALTVYDMCKSVDKEMTIGKIRLVRKTGGRGGAYERREG